MKYLGPIALLIAMMILTFTGRVSADPLTVTNDSGKEILLDVELANTPEERELGLMFRDSLPQNSGMLFIFDAPQRPSFWMKNTFIPLDMIFIDEKGKVVKVHKMARPEDLTMINPLMSVKAVLEINGGMADKWEIGRKSSISVKNFTN